MLFNSVGFFAFLGLVLVIVHSLSHRWQNRVLLVASYVFYGWWDWRFLSLIAFSTVVDFSIARALDVTSEASRRKRLVLVSIVVNLGLLGVFKYFNFFVDSVVDILEGVGLGANERALNIVLPVGISFYTFQTLGYTLDVYRRTLRPCKKLIDFALYVSFFPQLVAGPIERASRLLPQITQPRVVGIDRVVDGAHLIMLGLFKKVVVADNLAPVVNTIYASPDPTNIEIIVATWCFAIQIYCDFSGYSLIARGVAKWLGVDLMKNFWLPYAARSPQEFWTRWHISLSTWLRDYLYISLGGNRGAPRRVSRNLMLTMVLGGLWHGAAWNFVLWGAFQGAILMVHRRFLGRHGSAPSGRAPWLTVFLMFQVTSYGWLLFRAESLDQIVDFTVALFSWPEFTDRSLGALGLLVVLGGPLMIFEWWQYGGRGGVPSDTLSLPRWPDQPVIAGILYASIVGAIVVLAPTGVQEFIYFQF